MDKYYTFQIVLHRKEEGTDVNETHEFRDCTEAQKTELSDRVWTKGVRIKLTQTCWEILSPFCIKQVFIILQDKKFNPDI